jgi:hypothetical protein
MTARLRVSVVAVCCLGFALPAAAQLNSSDLRAKFGPPFHRETFHVPQGFDLVVDYAPDSQVCKLVVPALMPSNEKVQNSEVMKQRMYEFLAALVPPSMRGKELSRRTMSMGAFSISSVEYEQVTISETRHAGQPFGNDTITVNFRNASCASL